MLRLFRLASMAMPIVLWLVRKVRDRKDDGTQATTQHQNGQRQTSARGATQRKRR